MINVFRAIKNGILKCEIIDTGCGISDNAINLLFSPFTQEDGSVTRKYGGTGLGLFITKKLIEKMNGEIKVHSKKNVGSDFVVCLRCEKDFNYVAPFIKRQIYEKRKALVVDDDPCNHAVMAKYLEKLGIDYEGAFDGSEAFHKYASSEPGYFSFIAMDIQMPHLDGISSAKMIRDHEIREKLDTRIPMIFISGNCREDERQEINDPKKMIRAEGFFRKPLKFADFQNIVKSILNKQNQIRIEDILKLSANLIKTAI